MKITLIQKNFPIDAQKIVTSIYNVRSIVLAEIFAKEFPDKVCRVSVDHREGEYRLKYYFFTNEGVFEVSGMGDWKTIKLDEGRYSKKTLLNFAEDIMNIGLDKLMTHESTKAGNPFEFYKSRFTEKLLCSTDRNLVGTIEFVIEN